MGSWTSARPDVGRGSCFVSLPGLIKYFYFPVSVLLVFNALAFFATVRSLWRSRQLARRAGLRRVSTKRRQQAAQAGKRTNSRQVRTRLHYVKSANVLSFLNRRYRCDCPATASPASRRPRPPSATAAATTAARRPTATSFCTTATPPTPSWTLAPLFRAHRGRGRRQPRPRATRRRCAGRRWRSSSRYSSSWGSVSSWRSCTLGSIGTTRIWSGAATV